jgi:tRNA1(Val) A37 N6-methylase TrmN6
VTATHGTLLGGRVQYAQPATGYRTGIEPVILAACIPARPGARVLEAGTGAGAGLLCLASRVPGLLGVGVERDAGQAALARANVAANGFDGLTIQHAELLAWQPDGLFDHAFANPPWHDADATPSPDAQRRASKQAGPLLLSDWAHALARALRQGGTLTLILPAARLADGIAALSGACGGDIRLLPLWPKPGAAAKIVVLQGIAGGHGGSAILPGLVLHAPAGGYTDAAEAVLRHGAALMVA